MRAKERGGWWTGYVLRVTTQRWLNESVTDRSVWWHYLSLIAPDHMRNASKGLVLFFVGAGWSEHGRGERAYHVPKTNDVFIRLAAPLVVDLGILGVMLHQVPMMPVTFYSSPPGISSNKSRKLVEEEITSFSLAMAIHDTSTPEWPIYMPMAKSVIRGMDAVQLAVREMLPHVPVEAFVTIGVSKRACMAWLSAVLDKRVVAFISYGYDLINFEPNMQHLLDSVGAVPIMGRSYVDYNLTRMLHSPQLHRIMSYTDPYFFRDRLTMPKLLISASNDEFFSMDDSYYYFQDLPAPALLKIVANLDHMVIQMSQWAYDASISFLSSLLHANSSCASLPASSRPSLTWTRPTTPTTATTPTTPTTPTTASSLNLQPSSNTPTTRAFLSDLPHVGSTSGFQDAEAAAVAAAVQPTPWGCVPKLPAVDWPQLRWRFDWPTFTIHATSDRKPLAVRAWTGRTFPGSKRRDFRFIVKQGITGCTVPFKIPPPDYVATFGTLCVQPIPFLLHTVTPPTVQPDGLWHFTSTIQDIPKVGYRALFIEVDFKHGPFHKPFVLTTEAMIAPNTFPFAPCNSTACLTLFA
ncbi:hypothetical protein CLOM_g3789 [Closterium sp. NIES-68]|nr:hypothetical protein CLOM_g3789 [Closterium sp. NIES-68]GJP79807.1 hypothetical protein CLOP_g10021 [Closterium sp. NIES-67]